MLQVLGFGHGDPFLHTEQCMGQVILPARGLKTLDIFTLCQRCGKTGFLLQAAVDLALKPFIPGNPKFMVQ
jgi:hypothetical protein